MHIRIELYEQIALTDKLLTFPGAHNTLCHLLVLIFVSLRVMLLINEFKETILSNDVI